MAKFIATKDGRFINVAAIGEVKPTSDWTTWVAADLQGQHLATLHANFEPAVELAEIIPAAPGTTCLVVFPDRDALDVFHEIYAVIGWRCGDVDAVEPVLIEPVPGALLKAIATPSGGWCAPEDCTWDTLEAALETARERQRRRAPGEAAGGRGRHERQGGPHHPRRRNLAALLTS